MTMRRRELLAAGMGAAGATLASLGRSEIAEARADKFTLTLHFFGLCALVKTKPPGNGDNANVGRMYAIPINAARSGVSIPEHVPYLRVRAGAVANAAHFDKYRDGAFLKVPIFGQIVRFRFDGTIATGDVKGKRRPDKKDLDHCPQDDEWKEFTWLANFDLIVPTGELKPVKATYLSGTGSDLKNTPVAARVEIGDGRLVCAPPSDPKYGKQRADFGVTSKYHHIITDMASHVSKQANSIAIEFEAFDGPSVPSMTLSAFNNVDAVIENLLEPGTSHGTTHHFAAFYSLLDGYAGTKYQPDAGEFCTQTHEQPDWPLYCPPPLI